MWDPMQMFETSNILEIPLIVLHCPKDTHCSFCTDEDLWNNMYYAAPGKSPAHVLDQMTPEAFELSIRSTSKH